MPHDADASYKLLFSAPEVVRDLVLGFIPDDWLHSLDYTTLEKIPGSYVTDVDDPQWKELLGKYLAGIIDLGFDGVVLDDLDTYLWFEELMPLDR